MAFGPKNIGLRGRELEQRVTAALRQVGLLPMAEANPYDLGFSERKLLALASVIAMGTPAIVLDEPTTGQDADGVARVKQIVAQLSGESRTVVAVSHDMNFVAETFERVLVMRDGRVVLDGPVGDVFGETELADARIDLPGPSVAGTTRREAWLWLDADSAVIRGGDAPNRRTGLGCDRYWGSVARRSRMIQRLIGGAVGALVTIGFLWWNHANSIACDCRHCRRDSGLLMAHRHRLLPRPPCKQRREDDIQAEVARQMAQQNPPR